MTDTIYTNIGSAALVALNAHKYVASSSDSVLQKYAAHYRDTSPHKDPLPLHIFQLAKNAYNHIGRRRTGPLSSASGKSENRRLAIKTLLELSVSSAGKKVEVGHAGPRLRYTELQFSERGRFVGVKTLNYYLERNRRRGATAPPARQDHIPLSRPVPHRLAAYLPAMGTPVFGNGECIRLLQNTPGGLVHIVDDQARRAPKKTDAMVEAFAKRWGHSSFKSQAGPSPSFTISHFNGPVTYAAYGFLARNLDTLNRDFLSFMRGEGEGERLLYAFCIPTCGLAASPPRRAPTTPSSSPSSPRAQSPLKPILAMRNHRRRPATRQAHGAPSMRRKGTIRRPVLPGLEGGEYSWGNGDRGASDGNYNGNSAALPLVANAPPFQRADMHEDEGGYGSGGYGGGRGGGGGVRFTSAADERETASNFGNMFGAGDIKSGGAPLLDKDALAREIQEGETAEVLKETSARRRWVTLCWLLTWRGARSLPSTSSFGSRVGQRVLSIFGRNELQGHNHQTNPNNVFTSGRGEVFDLNVVTSLHSRVVGVVPAKTILKTYGGGSVDNIFPVQVSALCNGVDGGVSPYVVFSSSNNTDQYSQYHDFRFFTNDSQPDWYFRVHGAYALDLPSRLCRYHAEGDPLQGQQRLLNWRVQRPRVRLDELRTEPAGYIGTTRDECASGGHKSMSDFVVAIFKLNAGGGVTKDINNLVGNGLTQAQLDRQNVCPRNLFTIGKVSRESAKCVFSTYILLILSIIMVSFIGFKFLASISSAGVRTPEDHDKFVICQVPCYNECARSLRRTIESLAQLKYDDKRKLLFIICDGMIVGSGNNRPTPRVVLDILGADPNLDPEPLFLESRRGREATQHGSGLGKRDSEMLLMHFLNKVHFNSPMNPLELEMYHQIKNVIGVNPTFYEYVFMVDAGGSVLSQLPHFIYDSIITMQVYEYFISHNMAKAFESLFGSPLLIFNQLVQDYAKNRVDTLHIKNLLHLGEDRYLTTLLLKYFPLFKTQFSSALAASSLDYSTVHNLGDPVFLEQLCGFCCFSMRLLLSPISPISSVTPEHQHVQTISLIMILAVYAIQALVFMPRRKWDMIVWMFFHILAVLVFSFMLPLYSFWKINDFS
ncbi:chitin synthase-domain-containing protein [Mycena filopes]|nr:chitin synthase-domain-containing protein [Mycena filopes]